VTRRRPWHRYEVLAFTRDALPPSEPTTVRYVTLRASAEATVHRLTQTASPTSTVTHRYRKLDPVHERCCLCALPRLRRNYDPHDLFVLR